MTYRVDMNKHISGDRNLPDVTRNSLFRTGSLFFIGGNLPVYETLETMFESHCQASTELFYVIFGDETDFSKNIELLRQIKKNFSVRLIARPGHLPRPAQIETIYMAGADILDLPVFTSEPGNLAGIRKIATSIFQNWTTVSSIPTEAFSKEEILSIIDDLLNTGIIPLLTSSGERKTAHSKEYRTLLNHLAEQWNTHNLPAKALRPLLHLITPIVLDEPGGLLRNAIERLENRGSLLFSDLRRHLRTSGATESLDSASL